MKTEPFGAARLSLGSGIIRHGECLQIKSRSRSRTGIIDRDLELTGTSTARQHKIGSPIQVHIQHTNCQRSTADRDVLKYLEQARLV